MAEIKVYSVEEVADILKLTTRTIYAYIKSGQLKASKIGKYWRITPAALQDFIERGTH